jgi:hypothetical protein
MATLERNGSLILLIVIAFSLTPLSPFSGDSDAWAQERLREYTVKTLYAPPEDDPRARGSYPRVIQLKHHVEGQGHLLATFALRPSIPIYRSTDNGESWQQLSRVTGLRSQPALYELPRQAGAFPAGTVLAAGMAATNDRTTSSLQVYYSSDGGKRWDYLSTIVEGGRQIYDPAQRAGDIKETPVWEPYLYLDAQGRLVAYYSDERFKADGYNQLLAHKISEDGGRTWGDVEFDVAVPDGQSRAGMSVVTRMGDGRYVLIFEVVSLPGYPLEPRSNPVFFKVSEDGVDYGDPTDIGTLIQDNRRQFLWATPYIVWTPYGGPNGTLVASSRGVMREDVGQVGNGVMINRNRGEGFWTLLETPIYYIPGPSGYSSTMIPLDDGREILQLVPVDGHIRYAKFSLPD